MRIVLGAAALVTAGVLATALVLALRPPQPAKARAAGRSGAQARHGRPAAGSPPTTLGQPSPAVVGYTFALLDDARDKTFNQLLGINNLGHIAGYFGSGAAGHPYHGYILRPPYARGKYELITVPGAKQVQLTGLNEKGVQVGFWSAQNNANLANGNVGFYIINGRLHKVVFPTTDNASPPVNQLLGVNDHDVAVGFYTDHQGHRHGYLYDIATKNFGAVTVPGGSNVVAAAINNSGGTAGFFTGSNGVTSGFYTDASGRVFVLNAPHATLTQALGVNDSGEVVGDYRVGSGGGTVTHGFTWTAQGGFATVDDPQGAATTTINGVNDAGDLVGFYVDAAGHTDGLLATPNS